MKKGQRVARISDGITGTVACVKRITKKTSSLPHDRPFIQWDNPNPANAISTEGCTKNIRRIVTVID